MISSRLSILSPIYLIIYLSYLMEDRCFNPLFNQTQLTSALQHHLQLNFKFSQSPEKVFKTLLCCLIFFTQRYKKLVITSRANLWPKGLFYARFQAFVVSLCELNRGCVTPGYNFEDTCSFLERIYDSDTAGSTSICGAFGNVSFPKVH